MKMKNIDLKLKEFEFSEKSEKYPDWSIEKFSLGEFNILLSDNAQGKTRMFNALRFLKDLHTVGRKFNNPSYKAKATLWFESGEDKIFYYLALAGEPKGDGLVFNEIVKRNEKILFDRSKKILIDETNDEQAGKFFLPSNAPVALAVKDKEYITINLIQDFFSRMLFLEANRFAADNLSIDKAAMTLDAKGQNTGCVLNNWREKKPLLYNEVIEVFRDCFPFIKGVSIEEKAFVPGMPDSPIMYMKEKNIAKEIIQTSWSDGMLRALSHFAVVSTQFQSETDAIIRPSFIGVDEVENGLDFNTLAKVIEHYESYSSLIQIVIATHSPLACNMVGADKWLIMKRKGVKVKVFSPSNVENLETERRKIKNDNWEFYRRHIAKSKLYRIT